MLSRYGGPETPSRRLDHLCGSDGGRDGSEEKQGACREMPLKQHGAPSRQSHGLCKSWMRP